MNEQELIDAGLKEGKISFELLAKEIHDSFNWENVHKAMMALNWCWSLGKDEDGTRFMGVPDIDTIKRKAYQKLKEVYETGNQISSGGFSAGWDGEELFLVFTLEETAITGYS